MQQQVNDITTYKVNLLRTGLVSDYLQKGFEVVSYDDDKKTIKLKSKTNYTVEYDGRVAYLFNAKGKNTYITDGTNWVRKRYNERDFIIKEEYSTGRVVEYTYYPNDLVRMIKDNNGCNEYFEYDSKGQETYYVNKDNNDNEIRWHRKEELDNGNCIHKFDSEFNWSYEFKKEKVVLVGKRNVVRTVKYENEHYIYSKSKYNNFVALYMAGMSLFTMNVKKGFSESEIAVFKQLFYVLNHENYEELKRKR